MRVECSCGSEAPLDLVSPDLEIQDSYLKVLCLLLIQQALSLRFNYSTLDQRYTPGEICYMVYCLAMIDSCSADSPERFQLY
jgi:hypothetical protein